MSEGIKVLVATKECQDKELGDFYWTNDDELLMFGFVCCSSKTCGCDRSMVGVNTRRGTTTFRVSRWRIDRDRLVVLIADSEMAAWKSPKDKAMLSAAKQADEILRVTEKFQEGTVLGLTGDRFVVRSAPRQ